MIEPRSETGDDFETVGQAGKSFACHLLRSRNQHPIRAFGGGNERFRFINLILLIESCVIAFHGTRFYEGWHIASDEEDGFYVSHDAAFLRWRIYEKDGKTTSPVGGPLKYLVSRSQGVGKEN